MSMKWLTVGLMITSIACSPALARDLSDAEKMAIKQAVRASMKDPESSRFKWGPVASENVYCGLVNSKNSYGGYTGDKMYNVIYGNSKHDGRPHAFFVRFTEDETIYEKTTLETCAENGYDSSYFGRISQLESKP